MPKLFFRAQGTVEYLVIIAVIIVIGLAVTMVLSSQMGGSESISKSSSKLGNLTSGIAITESSVSSSDNSFVVRLLNNSGDTLTVSNVRVGDTNVYFSEDLAQGGSRFFKVSGASLCENGKVVSTDVIITYVSSNGVIRTERYPAKVMFECSAFSIAQSNLATQCPSTACVMVLHSGQTLSYDSGALDDKEQDGTAKSSCFTDNGDGTVSDSCTGLMWQKYNSVSGMLWEDALTFCDTNASVYSDWRLPSNLELMSIVDYNCALTSAACTTTYTNSVFGETLVGTSVWSSTTAPTNTTYAYAMAISDGILTPAGKTLNNFEVRCVRG